jgi:signal transduction histidine kinase
MVFTIREKLVFCSLTILIVVSLVLTLVHFNFARSLVEADLAERAVAFARELAATIGDQRELESSALLERQIHDILVVRQNVAQLDILTFGASRGRVVATSHAGRRLPFTLADAAEVRRGRVVSRLVQEEATRYWEVIAPVTFDGTVAGAVAARFSLDRADAMARANRRTTLGLTAVGVLVMAVLMSGAVHWIVVRPLQRFLSAVRRVERGDDTLSAVDIATGDEFDELARHFNAMMGRLHDFNSELQARVKEATVELEGRYHEVERLNGLLLAIQRRLGHSERLALAGRVMAEVAHEVGTPLHSVAGHVELLRADLPPATLVGSVRRRLDIIESQLARTTEIIARLLDLTRREPDPPAPVDVNRLVGDTVDVVRPSLAQRQLVFELAPSPGLPPVLGHDSQLQQVVLNLLTNAMDATPPGGQVRMATRARAGQIELEVTDTGRGIPPAEQQHIFEPFFSTKAAGHGTGLGLSVSAQIVREHQGRIDVTSVEGRGTTVRVFLPADERAT